MTKCIRVVECVFSIGDVQRHSEAMKMPAGCREVKKERERESKSCGKSW